MPSTEIVQDASASSTPSDRLLLGALVVATVVVGLLPAALPIIR